MDPYLNITVGHYNANTDHFKELLDYSKNKNYKTLLNVVPAFFGICMNTNLRLLFTNTNFFLVVVRSRL